jgi:hypothetical protein
MYKYFPKINMSCRKTGFGDANLAAVAQVRSTVNKGTTGAAV